ncbi:MAG: hypothetical protein ACFFCS_17670 [Candidatus Hodarchaeota archaeon]
MNEAKAKKLQISNDFLSCVIFVGSFAATALLAIITGGTPTFPIHYHLIDKGVPITDVTMQFSLREILELVYVGPVFCSFGWYAYSKMYNNIPDDRWKKKIQPELNILYVIAITFIVMGTALHGITNRIHELMKDESLTGNEAYYTTYFYDEIISHLLIPAGFFGMLFINAILDAREGNKDLKLAHTEMYISIAIGAALSGTWTFSLLEGQVDLFYSIIFTIIPFFVLFLKWFLNKRKGWNFSIKNNPYILVLFVFCISNVSSTLTWLFWYWPPHRFWPFLHQPSEGYPAFWPILIPTLISFGICVTVAIIFTKKPRDLKK